MSLMHLCFHFSNYGWCRFNRHSINAFACRASKRSMPVRPDALLLIIRRCFRYLSSYLSFIYVHLTYILHVPPLRGVEENKKLKFFFLQVTAFFNVCRLSPYTFFILCKLKFRKHKFSYTVICCTKIYEWEHWTNMTSRPIPFLARLNTRIHALE